MIGTVLILLGNCINITSSTHDSSAYSKADLVGFYDQEYRVPVPYTTVNSFLFVTISGFSRLILFSFLQSFLFFELSIAFGMHLLYLHYKLAKGRGVALYEANLIMPLSYSLCSAIIGTQSAIQGKCLSELINMTVNGEQAYSVPSSSIHC